MWVDFKKGGPASYLNKTYSEKKDLRMSSFSSKCRTKYVTKMNNVVVITSTITRMMIDDRWMDGW